jgi:hypothetical protein
VFFQLKDIDDLMDVIPKTIDLSYCYKDEMIYILFENKIFGINLKMYAFFKFNVDDIIVKIKGRVKSGIYDVDGNYYQSYYKVFPNFAHLKRYVVVM